MWALPDLFVLWPKDRPSNALSAGSCPGDTNSALRVPGTLGSSTAMVLGAAKPPQEHQGSHPLMGADIKPSLVERKVCTWQYERVLWAPEKSQVLWNTWAEITYMEETKFCCQPYSGLPFQAQPQSWILWTAKQTLCKGMCSAHFRRSAAQCAGSEVTGILPLASVLLNQNLRKVVSACSPGTPVDTPKESANGTWKNSSPCR